MEEREPGLHGAVQPTLNNIASVTRKIFLVSVTTTFMTRRNQELHRLGTMWHQSLSAFVVSVVPGNLP
jgi:hypothetical protein